MVRTKAFVITIVLMPVLMLGAVLMNNLLRGRVDLEELKIVVVDGTRALFPALEEQARRRNDSEIFDPESGRQVEPRWTFESVAGGEVTDEQLLGLCEMVRKRESTAVLVIPAEVLETRGEQESGSRALSAQDPARANETAAGSANEETPPPPSALSAQHSALPEVRLYMASAISMRLQRWVTATVNDVIHRTRLADAGIDLALLERATAPVMVADKGLVERDPTGKIVETSAGGRELAVFFPMLIMMLMFTAIMITANPMMQSVLEEKQQRIAEVLLGSARPFELMTGKLLGNVGVSLTLVAVYFIGGYVIAAQYGHSRLIPPRLVGWFLVYEILAVLLYGSVFIAIGAACSDFKDAQSLLMPVMIVLVAPMMIWFHILDQPMSTFATWVSLIPPSTPMIMVLRMATTSAVPLWQPLAGIAGVLAMTLVCAVAAGRIFRIGMLSQGKAPRLAELARWMVRG
jgi:ABC-2 type transport system permease protein